MKVHLLRLEHTKAETLGILLINGELQCVTLEPPWRNNESIVSAIPPGDYRCRRIYSPRFGETFLITNVPARSSIEFHWGNTYLDTTGCVLVGTKPGSLGGRRAVLGSREAFERMMGRMEGINEFDLTVTSWKGAS